MNALDELQDDNNWSGFAWSGARSLKLEIVPELAAELAALLDKLDQSQKENVMLRRELDAKDKALDEAKEILRHCALIWGSAPGEAALYLAKYYKAGDE